MLLASSMSLSLGCENKTEFFSLKVFLFITNKLWVLLQIQKIIRCKGTLKIAGLIAADVNDKGQLLARTFGNRSFYIRVMNRFSGKVSSDFPSKCEHTAACLISHPTDAGFVLEGCLDCEVIRNYNIHTGECSIVYRDYIPHTICHGPIGSILACSRPIVFGPTYSGLSIMKWDKEHRELRTDKSVNLEDNLFQMCYSELCDVLVGVFKYNEIKAMKLKSEATTLRLFAAIWKLPTVVDDSMISPESINSDKKGNIYVGDGVNNRILKINSFTGDIVSILLLEDESKDPIRTVFWSDTEPNLTVIRGDIVISYYILKSD